MSKEDWKQRYEDVQPVLEEKRFVVSRDEVLRERLHKVKEVFGEFQRAYPGVLGLSVYGSMSKGYAKEKSDLDLLLFIDEEMLSGDWQDVDEIPWVALPKGLSRVFGGTVQVNPDIYFTSKKKIDTYLADIQPYADAILQEKPVPEDYRKKTMDINELSKLFVGISINGSIDQYRAHVLLHLQRMGAQGELIWREMIDCVRRFERPRVRYDFFDPAVDKGKYQKLYPQTIAEAVACFVEHKPFRKKKNADNSAL